MQIGFDKISSVRKSGYFIIVTCVTILASDIKHGTENSDFKNYFQERIFSAIVATVKELNQITGAMGDSVRLQTLNVSSIIQANLKAEFVARRKNTLAI